MEENYLAIMIQSLEKKLGVLNEISSETAVERQLLEADDLDMDAFQAAIDKKSGLIDQIEFLDNGFETLYGHVKEALDADRPRYAQEIARLQDLIRQITDLTVRIQKEELGNRDLAERQFSGMRRKTRELKTSRQVATKYYKSMAKLNTIDPQFVDKKK